MRLIRDALAPCLCSQSNQKWRDRDLEHLLHCYRTRSSPELATKDQPHQEPEKLAPKICDNQPWSIASRAMTQRINNGTNGE